MSCLYTKDKFLAVVRWAYVGLMLYENRKQVAVLGVPCDLGLHLRGSNIAPNCLRNLNLQSKIKALGYEVLDKGDIQVPMRESLPAASTENGYVKEIADITSQLAHIIAENLRDGMVTLTLGGDHSLSIGAISGASSYFSAIDKKMGLIWVDAHADLNSNKTTITKNIHGMPLFSLLDKVSPPNISLVGIRLLDFVERDVCKNSGIRSFTMSDIDSMGMARTMREAIAFAVAGTDAIYLSFDLDAIDPEHAPGVNTPVMGGLTYREAHLLLEMLYATGKICGIDLVELNPMQDVSQKTAQLAIELVQSAFGNSIL